MLKRLIVPALLAVCAAVPASEALIRPGRRLAIIDTAHLRAFVPRDQAKELQPLVARAERIYVEMARHAGYDIRRRLYVLISDDLDVHNGFSTVIPFPLIQVELAPAPPTSGIFAGEDHVERTLVHEFAHHISNDRNRGFRRVLERIFGRVLPIDPLSLVLFYFQVPPHVTMPSFWHEGIAQWAETVYADPKSAWAGRGRDSLTHMVWRLDAASGAVPPVDTWRLSHHRWPYGAESYLYGIAYLRYLDGAYGEVARPWTLVDAQARQWPFSFSSGSVDALGTSHVRLIGEARLELLAEQNRQLTTIRTQSVTKTKRLTPDDTIVGAPAWTADGSLFAAWNGPYDRPHFAVIAPDGDVDHSFRSAYLSSPARSLSDGSLVWAESPVDTNPWRRSRIITKRPGDLFAHALPGERLIEPDIRRAGDGLEAVAVQLDPAGRQHLATLRPGSDAWQPLASEGRPWTPAWRPGHDELCWVETDHAGSRLVLAPRADPSRRTVLASVRGRILHPSWSADGARLYCCADHTGIANAYVIDFAAPAEVPAPAPALSAEPVPVAEPVTAADPTPATGDPTFALPAADPVDEDGQEAVAEPPVEAAQPAQPADAPAAAAPATPGGERLIALTNTIGGIVACVPSFDGKRLALVEHDRHGPYLAIITDDPATRPSTVPSIPLSWPAPVVRQLVPPSVAGAVDDDEEDVAAEHERRARTASAQARPFGPLPAGVAEAGAPRSYHGLANLRPLFWTPTTVPVPDGGIGVIGFAADPIFSHLLVASAGVGLSEATPVGLLGYAYGGWPLDIAVVGWQSERTYNDLLLAATGEEFDLVERVATGEARIGSGLAGLRRRFQTWLAVGISDTRIVDSAAEEYENEVIVTREPFRGVERYLEAVLAYDDATFFPTSYAPENGVVGAVVARHSEFDDGAQRDRIVGRAYGALSTWPSQGHQLVLGGVVGSSSGDSTLQGSFSVGGVLGLGLPRGYGAIEAVGEHLAGYSLAYRVPLYRPFKGFGSSPWVHRQVVLEGFFDAAKASSDYLLGDGTWFRSAGGELHDSWEFYGLLLQPGIGVAVQLDGDEDTVGYFALDFRL
ncbi:MAG: hypothetical protein H0W72_03865 [Planctomycetes bacterium]|nr:hypothetical protein [Planctomycetota bacterium]